MTTTDRHEPTIVEHWIGNELVTIDLDETWRATFAHWDSLVHTDVAASIATATVTILVAAERS